MVVGREATTDAKKVTPLLGNFFQQTSSFKIADTYLGVPGRALRRRLHLMSCVRILHG